MVCGRDAVNGYTRCVSHGAPVPSRNFYGRGNMTTGDRSSFPIVRLAARYNKMTTDGRVLSNRASIDIFDHRIKELLDRVDLKESPERIKRLHNLWVEYRHNEEIGNEVEKIQNRKMLDLEFEKIYHDYMAWEQVFNALELRGKAVEREIKVLKEIKAIMTAEDGYELAAKLLAAVMRVVGDDPKKMKQVQYEFTKIIGEPSDLVVESDGADVGEVSDSDGGEEGFSDVDQTQLLHTGNQE